MTLDPWNEPDIPRSELGTAGMTSAEIRAEIEAIDTMAANAGGYTMAMRARKLADVQVLQCRAQRNREQIEAYKGGK